MSFVLWTYILETFCLASCVSPNQSLQSWQACARRRPLRQLEMSFTSVLQATREYCPQRVLYLKENPAGLSEGSKAGGLWPWPLICIAGGIDNLQQLLNQKPFQADIRCSSDGSILAALPTQNECHAVYHIQKCFLRGPDLSNGGRSCWACSKFTHHAAFMLLR